MAREKFSPELRDRAVRMVFEHTAEFHSQWQAISSIAHKIGCSSEALRLWVRRTEGKGGGSPGDLNESDRAKLNRLERETFELRRANEILRKASAYFAQAELDRRGK